MLHIVEPESKHRLDIYRYLRDADSVDDKLCEFSLGIGETGYSDWLTHLSNDEDISLFLLLEDGVRILGVLRIQRVSALRCYVVFSVHCRERNKGYEEVMLNYVLMLMRYENVSFIRVIGSPSDRELKRLMLEYGGKFNSIIGTCIGSQFEYVLDVSKWCLPREDELSVGN